MDTLLFFLLFAAEASTKKKNKKDVYYSFGIGSLSLILEKS